MDRRFELNSISLFPTTRSHWDRCSAYRYKIVIDHIFEMITRKEPLRSKFI